MDEPINVLHAVMPEKDNFTLGDSLCSFEHQLDYIIKMPKRLSLLDLTYLLL